MDGFYNFRFSTIRYDICGVNLRDSQNFKENILSKGLIQGYEQKKKSKNVTLQVHGQYFPSIFNIIYH